MVRGFERKLRYYSVFLLAIFLSALIPYLTVYGNSVQVNSYVAIINFLIFLFFVSIFFDDLMSLFDGYFNRAAVFFLISFFVLVSLSLFFVGGYDGAFYYLSFLFLFYSLFKFFKLYPDSIF